MPNKSIYNYRKEKGLCPQCGKSNDRRPKTECSICFEKGAARHRMPEHLAKARISCRRWRLSNPQKKLACTQSWRKRNPDKVKAARRKQAAYIKSYVKRKRQKLRCIIIKIKEHYGCMNPKCGHIAKLKACCLDFHHVKQKKFTIGLISVRSLESLAVEINKCTVLCAICHRLVTWEKIDTSAFPTCKVDVNCDLMQ